MKPLLTLLLLLAFFCGCSLEQTKSLDHKIIKSVDGKMYYFENRAGDLFFIREYDSATQTFK